MPPAAARILSLARKSGVIRTADITAVGIPRVELTRLERSGQLVRAARGIYRLPNADITEHHALAEASARVQHGVVCLLSALRFHEMTTQQPFEVWLAIDPKSRKPALDSPPLRIVRFSPQARRIGVDRHMVEGVSVAVTSPARTVVDCFRYRSKIGLDVALEALREYRRAHRRGMDALWKIATAMGAMNVIRPYAESLG